MEKIVSIYCKDYPESIATKNLLKKKLEKENIKAIDEFSDKTDLLISIGGDGTFLEAIHELNFPKVKIAGINTGHLGFFQEIIPEKIDEFIYNYKNENYEVQELSPVLGIIQTKKESYSILGLNEIVVRNSESKPLHMNISIGGEYIEKFNGDGVLVSAPAGSTGYNYSLGGSIIDPRLNLLQLTPIAPMNTSAYRSFTSSILLPPDLSLGIIPKPRFRDKTYESNFEISYDGIKEVYEDIEEISLSLSKSKINLLRFPNYDFWTKVKNKLL